MRRVLRKLFRSIFPNTSIHNGPLSENGERVDIDLCSEITYETMDMYQKNHFQRYLFAQKFVKPEMTCGDFACGSGYGSALIAQIANKVIGIDIKQNVIDAVNKRYSSLDNLEFICNDLLKIDYEDVFDLIVSFETVEHVKEFEIIELFKAFYRALKHNGIVIFSTPYLQKKSKDAVELGFHQTFDIDETKISSWLKQTGFLSVSLHYQNYQNHEISSAAITQKEIIICVARKGGN